MALIHFCKVVFLALAAASVSPVPFNLPHKGNKIKVIHIHNIPSFVTVPFCFFHSANKILRSIYVVPCMSFFLIVP